MTVIMIMIVIVMMMKMMMKIRDAAAGRRVWSTRPVCPVWRKRPGCRRRRCGRW